MELRCAVRLMDFRQVPSVTECSAPTCGGGDVFTNIQMHECWRLAKITCLVRVWFEFLDPSTLFFPLDLTVIEGFLYLHYSSWMRDIEKRLVSTSITVDSNFCLWLRGCPVQVEWRPRQSLCFGTNAHLWRCWSCGGGFPDCSPRDTVLEEASRWCYTKSS